MKLDRPMTLEEFQSLSTVDLETLAIVNGVEAGERLEAGRTIKRIGGGELPG